MEVGAVEVRLLELRREVVGLEGVGVAEALGLRLLRLEAGWSRCLRLDGFVLVLGEVWGDGRCSWALAKLVVDAIDLVSSSPPYFRGWSSCGFC